MLAENFKTAAELGLPEIERQSLITVLHMLERGEIVEFNMADVKQCLCAWAHRASLGMAFPELSGRMPRLIEKRLPNVVRDLFMLGRVRMDIVHKQITPAKAAIALRTYLVTGEERWPEALAAIDRSEPHAELG
jgi:hypothetical protein